MAELAALIAAFPGVVGVFIRDAQGAASFAHNADAVLATASMAKIALLVSAAVALERGESDATQLLDRDSAPFVRDSGIWWHLDQQQLSLGDVAKLVGTVSDNLATNVLLAHLGGVDVVADVAGEYGLTGFTLHDFVRDERGPQHPPTLSTGTARGYADAFDLLHGRAQQHDPVAVQVLSWLADSADLSMVASAFALDPLAHSETDRGIAVINKTGTADGVRADAGLVTVAGETSTYCCLLNWAVNDEADAHRDTAMALMRAIGDALRRR